MQRKDDTSEAEGVGAHNLRKRAPFFADRESEARRIEEAVREKQSLVICGPGGIGKTALVLKVIRGLPREFANRCLYLGGAKDLQDLLRQLIRALYDLSDANLRRQLHATGVSALTFEAWLKALPGNRLKGTLYRTVEQGDYRIFLDHLPPLTLAVAKVIKELFWMRKTPVYFLSHDEMVQRMHKFYSFFYWGDRERLALQPLPAEAAAELLENCIERFELYRLELDDFRKEVLELSKRVPGAIVKMCSLAADPRYQYESRIKIKSVYIDYLMSGHDLRFPATKRSSAMGPGRS